MQMHICLFVPMPIHSWQNISISNTPIASGAPKPYWNLLYNPNNLHVHLQLKRKVQMYNLTLSVTKDFIYWKYDHLKLSQEQA